MAQVVTQTSPEIEQLAQRRLGGFRLDAEQVAGMRGKLVPGIEQGHHHPLDLPFQNAVEIIVGQP